MAAVPESARTEQIVSQFLLKSLHVILSSRIPTLRDPPRGRSKNRDRWFNLAIGDTPPSLDSLNFWHRSFLDPMVIDILLSLDHDTVLERWIVQYDSTAPHAQSRDSSPSTSKTYKKSIVLLRSIHSLLRFLPAYKPFRMLTSSNSNCNFTLGYKVSSFAEPFSTSEEAQMSSWTFSPVDTHFGQLSASLAYRPTLDAFNLEASPLLPPRIIPDYVGSPAAEPARAFPPSISGKSLCSTTFPFRGEWSGPGAAGLSRPHSWTSPPMAHFPLGTSPESPISMVSGRQVTDRHLFRTMSSGAKRGSAVGDENRISPPFSASPTPSPPTYSNSPLRNRLQMESSPVSIPMPAGGRNLLHRAPSDPLRSFLPPPSPRNARVETPPQGSPLDGRSFRKIEGFRTGEPLPSSLPSYGLMKGVKDVKDESGRFSGILSSCNSPRVGFSRSSSRLSFADDHDAEFSCPFDIEFDTQDSQMRNSDGKDGSESSQPHLSTRKSQDAEVGVLVHILRTAPPLRQDSCSSQSSRSEYGGDVSSSSFFMSRRASDALEELRSYKEMKEMLLSQSGSKFMDPVNQWHS